MKNGIRVLFAVCLLTVTQLPQAAPSDNSSVAIAIHGGAGTLSPDDMTDAQRAEYISTLQTAVTEGYKVLLAGEPGEAAVIRAIQIMEMSPLFNAGIGAVYTFDGEHELDASIMNGRELNAGAVSGVKTIKSPIMAAYRVMTESPHVMLSAEGAEAFARQQALEMVDNTLFNTQRRYEALQKAKARMQSETSAVEWRQGNERFGTVGAVVLDKQGNLVAGTSTGGMTAKRFGRIGDSPIIGAGTYADNTSCAVSATGHGEYFIRYHVASDICARMKYAKMSLHDAANTVIHDVLLPAGGTGGVIAIDAGGNVAMPFNTSGMYRASIDKHGNVSIGIYKEIALKTTFSAN
ncbi:isoaspartyl peptidase/L-asparaginase [Alteromonas sediminis]|uniref:Isoaspartyl peptidase n=1 Tax=Alteromonas sediminis TaxID=2259342 RepID=A0A3N5Y8C0_9ALTE|nr:isoaspartyl peptidase/L-asparaginase [Alteromonas sediminis]RPJ67279.1 isoaspartyl peptidase/L-asparaginase [Alteromonas sediminis]